MNEEESEKSISFVRENSIKPKVIGHNKIQIQLEELHIKFQTSQKTLDISQQFNDTLQDEYTFLKTQNNKNQDQILTLNNELVYLNKELDILKQKYTYLEESTKNNIIDMENEKKTICLENISLSNTISDFVLEKDIINTKYIDIKTQYQTLLSNFVIKSDENIILTNLLNDKTITCSLYIDTNLQLQIELDSINLEMDKLKKEIIYQNTQLQEKDNIIGILHFKYSKEYPNIDITIESTEISEPTETIFTEHINSIENVPKGTYRGIKISKR